MAYALWAAGKENSGERRTIDGENQVDRRARVRYHEKRVVELAILWFEQVMNHEKR